MRDASLSLMPTPTGVRFGVRVMPRAPRTVVDGLRGGRLLVRVSAPPLDGAANSAALTALASALDVPLASLRIVAGTRGRNKMVEVAGRTPADVRARLERLLPPSAPGHAGT
jgi:uncharacterized protein YggU (UPF0235/DUF167 family)